MASSEASDTGRGHLPDGPAGVAEPEEEEEPGSTYVGATLALPAPWPGACGAGREVDTDVALPATGYGVPVHLALSLLPGDVRAYVVWRTGRGGAAGVAGVHWGPYPQVWEVVRGLLAGEEYSYARGSRLRRVWSIAQGVEAFYREALDHGLVGPCALYYWA